MSFFFQVFQVRKVQGPQTGKIFAMKVLRKVYCCSPHLCPKIEIRR